MNDNVITDDFLQSAYAVVSAFPGRVPCRRAIRLIAEKIGSDTRIVRKLINQLVDEGRLRFVNDCGASFLERSFLGRHRVSPHVILSTITTPAELVSGEKETVVVRVMPGAAFGDCRHPTTRLSIQALDAVVYGFRQASRFKAALDIGTGTGILAVTAARLGVKQVVGTDIDQCARKEARDNVALNGLEHAVQIVDMPVPAQPESFSIVMANLRPPTLKRLATLITAKTHVDSVLVLSGMKTEETEGVVDKYRPVFECVRKEEEAGWCGLVLLKKKEVSYDV